MEALEDFFGHVFWGNQKALISGAIFVKFQEAYDVWFHESSELIFLFFWVFFFHGRPWVSFFGIFLGAFLR